MSGVYEATGKVDCTVTEEAEGGRSFDGIGILWHRNSAATAVGGR